MNYNRAIIVLQGLYFIVGWELFYALAKAGYVHSHMKYTERP